MTKIHKAYCKELGKVVDANEARHAYLRLHALARWSFLCEREDCRHAGVRVVCANYWRSAEKEATFVAAHYRHLDEHLDSCSYNESASSERHDRSVPSDVVVQHRSSKIDNSIQVFDPDIQDDDGSSSVAASDPADSRESNGNRRGSGVSRDDRSSISRTSFVEQLVAQRSSLEIDHGYDVRDAKIVDVRRHGRFRFGELFLRVRKVPVVRDHRIWFGGCELVRRNLGSGFQLRFKDTADSRPVVLTVDAAALREYRYRRSILDLVEEASAYRYLKVFAWGRAIWNGAERHFEIKLDSLKHLALYPGKTIS